MRKKHYTEQNYFDKRKKMWSVSMEIWFFFRAEPVQKLIHLLESFTQTCNTYMQLGNVYIICNILHQHLPLVILVCWNDGLNLTH